MRPLLAMRGESHPQNGIDGTVCAEYDIDSGGSPRGIPPHASEPSLSYFSDIIDELDVLRGCPQRPLRRVNDS